MHPVLRIGTAALVTAGLCAIASPADAKDGLSVGFGFGYKIDANQLGQTISTDGLDAAAPRPLALPGFDDTFSPGTTDPAPEFALLDQSAIIAENSLVVLEDLEQISNLETGGAMVAFDLHIHVRYDFLDVLFARLGFNYNFKGIGGRTSWTSEYGDHLQEWDYSAIGIPLHIGVNVPIAEGKYNVYAGVGVAWASGGFNLHIVAPEGFYYAAVNDPLGFSPNENNQLDATPLGAIDEQASIEGSAIGLGYLIGVDGAIADSLHMFVEAETQYVAKMSEAVAFSDEDSGRLFGASKLAYPAIPGGQVLRLGVKYMFDM